jgi:hypothetical protein
MMHGGYTHIDGCSQRAKTMMIRRRNSDKTIVEIHSPRFPHGGYFRKKNGHKARSTGIDCFAVVGSCKVGCGVKGLWIVEVSGLSFGV